MIVSELIHNPYLLKTTVKFNGQSPRINSQIEKYEAQALKEWVHKVPEIFYDEMNGYDFDLNFTGTKADFDDIKQAFEKTGVSSKDVRLFLKNELEDAETKSNEIDTLVKWLKDNPNRKFDCQGFFDKYTDLFEGVYPYIVINSSNSESFNSEISIETVNGAEDLKGTVLTNTPVLFCIDEGVLERFRFDLVRILEREDVQGF